MNKFLTMCATTLLLGSLFAASNANATVYSYDIEFDLNNAALSSSSTIRLVHDFTTPFTLNTGDTLQLSVGFVGDQKIEMTKSSYDQQRIDSYFFDIQSGFPFNPNFSSSFLFSNVEGDFNEAYRLVEYDLSGAVNAGPFQKAFTDSSFSFGGAEISVLINDAGTTPVTIEAFTLHTGMATINTITPVSEPQLIGLLGLGLIGFAGFLVRSQP